MDSELLSVGSLHALVYCERLFYLEEVERIRVADQAVYEGRALHEELTRSDEEGSWSRPQLESAELGLIGAVDVLRKRNGELIPYEHKRGRSAGSKGRREVWQTDRIQVGAYGLLVEEAFGQSPHELRVRYHADHVTVSIPFDAQLRADVTEAIRRARALAASVRRPPVASNERLCVRCSLAPVCLPEEARLAADPDFRPIRLLPPHPTGATVHVDEPGMRIGRSGEQLVLTPREGEPTNVPIAGLSNVVVHGFGQITTQALRLCADHDVQVHWMGGGGGLIGSLAPSAASAQRHLRQFEALSDEPRRFDLAKRLVAGKCRSQLRFVLRATRSSERDDSMTSALSEMRSGIRRIGRAETVQELLGHEGSVARAYFGALPRLLGTDLDPRLISAGRSRRPPRDRFNAALSYGYGMLYRAVLSAIIAVGLHPGMGFYHRPRSASHPLALDLMELFRVPLVDMPLVASFNRRTFDAERDFLEFPGRVVLTREGRRKVIDVFERRMRDSWRHDIVGYSLSYARIVELEARLLEKEWMGEGGLFAQFRIR